MITWICQSIVGFLRVFNSSEQQKVCAFLTFCVEVSAQLFTGHGWGSSLEDFWVLEQGGRSYEGDYRRRSCWICQPWNLGYESREARPRIWQSAYETCKWRGTLLARCLTGSPMRKCLSSGGRYRSQNVGGFFQRRHPRVVWVIRVPRSEELDVWCG